MAKLNRPNGKLFGSSATNIGVFGSGQTGETPTTSTNPDAINTLGTHWEDGWNGAVVSQAPYTAPFVEDMNAVNYVNSYNGAYLLQQGIPEYSRTVDYYVDSVCTYNGAIYICILDNPAVNASTDPNDPPGTLINFDPTDTTHWDERVELPTMNDNEVLVGSVGGTGVATDTLNQGDIVASSGGLDIKSGVIVNADVKSDAAIAESKLALDHSTDSLNTAISNKAISNLYDTTITTPIGDGDVLLYDDNSSKWVNSDSLANHLADTNNPHDTSMANLDDTNVNDRQTLADGDVMVYDLANTDWVNSPSLKNHLSDTNNPHTTTLANLDDTTITTPQDGDAIIYDNNSSKWINTPLPGGAISTLSDTTITTPQEGDLLQYDYANSKWVNSDDIPTKVNLNSKAYIGSTPQGHTVDANNDVAMLATDNRTQILTATDGYGIVLPSTGIKKGEKFTFIWLGDSWWTTLTTPFVFKNPDLSANKYAWVAWFVYSFTALVDNPSSSTDWDFDAKHRITRTTSNWGVASTTKTLSWTANNRATGNSNTIITLSRGVWDVKIDIIGGCTGTPLVNNYLLLRKNINGVESDVTDGTGMKLGMFYRINMPCTDGSSMASVYQKSAIIKFENVYTPLYIGYSYGSNAGESHSFKFAISATLIAPIVDNIT